MKKLGRFAKHKNYGPTINDFVLAAQKNSKNSNFSFSMSPNMKKA